MIRGLRDAAYRCQDSEETRQFYENFLGLPLAATLEITQTKTEQPTHAPHTFYRMRNGSFLAFFEVPDSPFDFKKQHGFDLHIAVEVPFSGLSPMLEKGKNTGIESRGISDHGFIHSICFRDPNGHVIELTARLENHDESTNPEKKDAHFTFKRRQKSKDIVKNNFQKMD